MIEIVGITVLVLVGAYFMFAGAILGMGSTFFGEDTFFPGLILFLIGFGLVYWTISANLEIVVI